MFARVRVSVCVRGSTGASESVGVANAVPWGEVSSSKQPSGSRSPEGRSTDSCPHSPFQPLMAAAVLHATNKGIKYH